MADFGASAVFGGINTTFRFAEFVIALKEVGSENNVFVRTIQRVRLDLEETERLLSIPSIKLLLSNSPEKWEWMKTAIHSTKNALNDIGLYVERVRADKDRDGEITFAHRVRWVLKDHDKLENRRSELAACHQTLTSVLSNLHHFEMMAGFTAIAPPAPPNDAPPPAYEPSPGPDFRSPYQRKKKKPKAEIIETTVPLSNNEDTEIEKIPPSQPRLLQEQKSETLKYSTGTIDEVNPLGQQRFETFDRQPTPQPPVRIPSPAPSLAPSCMTSYSSNNFGPINAWDSWNNGPTEEIRLDAAAISPPLTHRMSVSSGISAISDSTVAQSPPRIPAKVQMQRDGYGPSDTGGYFSPVDTQQQTRTWLAAREPAASIYDLAEMDSMHISELPTESYVPHPRSLNQDVNLPVELGSETPTRMSVAAQNEKPKYTAWNPKAAGHPASGQMANYPPPQAQNSNMPNYRRAYSSPSGMLHPTRAPPTTIPYPERAVELPPAPSQSAYHPYRPRAQTDMNQTQYLYQSSRMMSSPASGYLPPRMVASPAPSFVSAMSEDNDFSSRNLQLEPVTLQPELVAPGCTIGRTAVSQSRRRRAMMGAALGVSGD